MKKKTYVGENLAKFWRKIKVVENWHWHIKRGIQFCSVFSYYTWNSTIFVSHDVGSNWRLIFPVLTWVLYFISRDHDVQQKLYAEVMDIVGTLFFSWISHFCGGENAIYFHKKNLLRSCLSLYIFGGFYLFMYFFLQGRIARWILKN